MRPIDADALTKKLKNHHDFFVNAYGGFSNLPEKEKARVDEITQCIADVQNAPTLTLDDLRPKGRAMWLPYYNGGLDRREYRCSRCWNGTPNNQDPRCLNCGSEMLREM